MITEKSQLLFERSKIVVPGGVHSPVRAFRSVGGVPRFISSAQSVRLQDVDGNVYDDYCMSWGPLIFGHQDPDVLEAVQSALRRGWSYGAAEPYSLELAEFITSRVPWVERIRFVNSGTEAVMAALRLARAVTGRCKILKFDGCYHGHVDSMLVRAGSGLAEMACPDSAGITQATAAETIVAPLDQIQAVEKIFEIHGKDIAAVIIEPVPANNGLLLQKDGFLHSVVNLARAAQSLVIFDEVITGFRVAFGGMAERAGIRPDLVTFGKIIGGGFPVGAYGGRKDLMQWIAPEGPVYQAGTLSANPIAMHAGLAMLKKLERLQPYADLERRTQFLADQMEAEAQKHRIPMRVQRFASMFWPIFGKVHTQDGAVRAPLETPVMHKEVYSQVFHLLLSHGIYLAPSPYEISFLSCAHQEADLQRFLNTWAKALAEQKWH
jgi:glutamate-1-semialdehyde 2,1-aminomutase